MTDPLPPSSHPPVPRVVLMLKAPLPGFCKTRLAHDLGSADRAAAIYRRLVERQLDHVPDGWSVEVHYAPADAGPLMRSWLGSDLDCTPQPEGDLGARMSAAMRLAFASGAPAVLFLGGDCPEFHRNDFYQTASALQSADVVIAPARDGGYCMLATRRNEPRMFEDIPWSTPEVFEITSARCRELGFAVECLRVMEDIDDLASLQRSGFEI